MEREQPDWFRFAPMVQMDSSCFELPIPGSAKPFVVLASGMLPDRQTRRGKSTALYTSSPKAKAFARASDLAIQACARTVLAFLIRAGKGQRWRSWFSADQIAALLPRSAHMPSYSKHHVRRARRQLVAAGIIRCIEVRPGECFPHKDQPDVDGSGMETQKGGHVVEINIDALLGRGPVWLPPPPSARELEASDAPPFPGLEPAAAVESPAADVDASLVAGADASPTPARDASSEPEGQGTGSSSMTTGGSSSMTTPLIPGSASQNKIDPAPPERGAPPAAPASDASETPSAADVARPSTDAPREPEASPARALPANVASETPSARGAPCALPDGPERPAERQRGREEQAKCQPPREPDALPPRRSHRVEPPSPASLAEMQAAMVRLFGPSARGNPAAPDVLARSKPR